MAYLSTGIFSAPKYSFFPSCQYGRPRPAGAHRHCAASQNDCTPSVFSASAEMSHTEMLPPGYDGWRLLSSAT